MHRWSGTGSPKRGYVMMQLLTVRLLLLLYRYSVLLSSLEAPSGVRPQCARYLVFFGACSSHPSECFDVTAGACVSAVNSAAHVLFLRLPYRTRPSDHIKQQSTHNNSQRLGLEQNTNQYFLLYKYSLECSFNTRVTCCSIYIMKAEYYLQLFEIAGIRIKAVFLSW